MSDRAATAHVRREAVQPSLWDRLVDDLPSVAADAEALGVQLRRELGAELVDRLVEGGPEAIAAEPMIEDLHRRELRDLAALEERRRLLALQGIVVDADVLREAVRRDIEALFNVERFECEPMLTDAEAAAIESPASLVADFPHVRRSVVNYGVPSFAGRAARDFDAQALGRELRDIVATFEPRLRGDSIVVRVDTGDRTGLRIEVEGVLMLSPVPERLRLSTTIDLDNGRAATRLGDR